MEYIDAEGWVTLWLLIASPEDQQKHHGSRFDQNRDQSTQGGFMHRYHILTQGHNAATVPGSTAVLG